MRARRRVVVVLLSMLAVAGSPGAILGTQAAAAPRADHHSDHHPYRLGRDGTTLPIYSYADAVRQTVWVDIGLDQDGDGVDDRVAADIIRPAGPARAHQRIPVIMDTSGYYQTLGRGNQMQVKTYDQRGRPVQFPLFLDNYFVPRGYAVVLVDLAGTNRSTGCTDFGGRSELRSSTRVIDWLNGRAPGYSSRFGPTRRYAGWASGTVGMIGKSWDGQNAVETAVTGISGLATIVPESAVTSDWTQFKDRTGSQSYDSTTADVTRDDGSLQNARALRNRHCRALLDTVARNEPLNGDYTSAWAYRDWSRRAARVRAAVLMTQGQNDTNVFPTNLRPFWDNLRRTVPKRLWLSEVGHVDPFDFRRAAWVSMLHRWFDRFLFGIRNGVLRGPQLSVERAPNYWVEYRRFPDPNARPVTLSTSTHGLALRPGGSGSVPVSSRTQDVEFTSPRLSRPVRLSGSVDVVVDASSSASANARIEAYLWDVGTTSTRGYSGRRGSRREFTGILNPRTHKSCWGRSRPGDSACFYVTPADVVTVHRQFIGWGTRDLQHHSSIRSVQSVRANRQYSLRIPSYMMDRVVPAGHRLALQVYGYGDNGALVSVHVPSTRVVLPVSGGRIRFAPET